MRRKHIASLAGLAALCMAAFAAPAANADYWHSEGNPLTESVEVAFSGPVNPAPGYAHCNKASGTLVLDPGDLGEITSITYSGCTAMGMPVTFTPLGLPWSVKAISSGASAYIFTDEVSENVKYNGQNLWTQMDSTWNLIPDNFEEMSSLTISGQNEFANMAYTGEFGLTPAGAYGIEDY
jgi:hypothetical protein